MADDPITPTTPTEALGNADTARDDTGTLVSGAAADPKPEPAKPEPTADASKPETAAEGPPEKYEFTPPEGYELDAAVMEEASAIFKDLGLTQAQANKLVEFHTKQAMSSFEEPFKRYQEMRTDWRNSVVADPSLGDGKDLKPEVRATLGRAIDSLGPKLAGEFREAMELTGAGDNPAVLRAIYALAQNATEGRPVKGAGPSPSGQRAPNAGPINPAKALFPNLPSASGT